MKEMNRQRVAAVTLGCKLNYAETSTVLDMMVSRGWHLSTVEEGAELIIVHTCAVTGQAEQKSRQQIRKIVRKNPGSRVAVIGCYAQLDPERLAGIDGVDLVLGSREKLEPENYLVPARDTGAATRVMVSSSRDFGETALPGSSMLCQPDKGRTRAFLKIQDGCSFGCSYCTIPNIRGRSRSVPFDLVLERAEMIAGAGYREIVLTGVNIADYRNGNYGFAGLLKRLEEVDVSRIRIGSVEPDLLDDELIEVIAASKKIMPNFHLPLQSGSDSILKLMGRHYDTDTYRKRLEKAVDLIPGCGIGADVMTGYPGEGELEFGEMYRFLHDLPLAYLHVFTCSVRPGTTLFRQVAARELTPVSRPEVGRRAAMLSELGTLVERRFAESFVGSRLEVLFEEGSDNGHGVMRWSGYSGNYLRIDVDVPEGSDCSAFRGREHAVMIDGIGEDLHLRGRLLF